MSTTNDIQIVLNGESRNVPAGTSILSLLETLDIDPSRVAVEWNRAIVKRSEWPAATLVSGDALEVVQFVGGG